MILSLLSRITPGRVGGRAQVLKHLLPDPQGTERPLNTMELLPDGLFKLNQALYYPHLCSSGLRVFKSCLFEKSSI